MVLPYAPTLPQIIPSLGAFGIVGFETKFFRATWDNKWLEDLTEYVISANVTHDPARAAGNWVLEATLDYDGWLRLRSMFDWVAVVQTTQRAGQPPVTRQLGHYLVLDSPERHEELGGTVRLDARDPLWVLQASSVKVFAVPLPQGERLTKVSELINGALVPGAPDTAKLRHTVTPIAGGPSVWLGPWREEDRRLTLANNALVAGNYFPLFTDETGVIHTTLKSAVYYRTPLKALYANVPEGVTGVGGSFPGLEASRGVPSEVVGAVDTSPALAEIYDEIRILGGLGSAGATVIGTATRAHFTSNRELYDPSVGVNPNKGGARIRKLSMPSVFSVTTANQIAARILEDWLTENTTVSLAALPDPDFIATHRTCELAIWNAFGQRVAQGKYLVKRVRYGLMVEDPLMRIDLGSVEDAIPL